MLCLQRGQLGRGGDVAVVADGHPAAGQTGCKGGAVGLAPVELAHDPGVDGQLTDGVAVIDVEDGVELLGTGDAQPGLDRDRPLRPGKEFVQKGLELCGVPQHPGTLALGGHSAGGTAEVEVHLRVAQPAQLCDHPCGQCAVLGEELGDDGRAGVRRRVKLGHLLLDEHPVLGRREEGRVITGGCARCAEPALMCLPPDAVRQPLHGGGVVLHRIVLLFIVQSASEYTILRGGALYPGAKTLRPG